MNETIRNPDDLIPHGEESAVIGEVPVGAILASIKRKDRSIRVKRYDFRRPDKFSRDQIRTLAVIHEGLARSYTATLSGLLRSRCELHVRLVDQMTLDEFTSTLNETYIAGVMALSPLPIGFVFALGGGEAAALIEVMGGSQDIESGAAGRTVTELERGALSALFGRLAEDLAEAWKPVFAVEGRFVGLELDPRNVRIVPPQDMIVLVEFDLSIGDFRGVMSFAIPYLLLEPILFELSAENFYFPKKNRQRTPRSLARISGIPLRSSLYYEAGALSLFELSSLKRGDLVPLEESEAPLVFETGGRPLLRMKATGRGSYAVAGAPGDVELFGKGDRWADPSEVEVGSEVGEASLLSRVASGMDAAFARVEGKLEELATRQNELADQVFFGKEEELGVNGEGDRPLAFASDLDRERLARFLAGEHPQTAALVLSSQDPAPAGDLLSRLPEEGQGEVAGRIARIGPASPLMVAELSSCLRRRRELSRGERSGVTGGRDLLAEMAKSAASQKTAAIIAEILTSSGPSPKPEAGRAGEKPARA